jgi:hypothetical protein
MWETHTISLEDALASYGSGDGKQNKSQIGQTLFVESLSEMKISKLSKAKKTTRIPELSKLELFLTYILVNFYYFQVSR